MSSFFNLYVQYAYQMKAENILNLKLISEGMICYIKICNVKILTSSFFNQYAYQMKAENILNLNLTSQHMICYKKLCIWSTFIFFVYEKILTGQLRRAPAARLCNFFTKKFHQQVPLDAKRKVKRCQVSTTTHTAAGRDQRRSGLIQPPPRSDRVKNSQLTSH